MSVFPAKKSNAIKTLHSGARLTVPYRADMDAAKSPPPASLRSKKQPHSPAPLDKKARKVPESDPNPWGVKTPSKPADPPRRLCNRRAAMSIKEIREAAMKLRGRRSDPPEPMEPVVESKVESVAKLKKPSGSEIKLPEKYELLDKFFNSLDSSIRLLRLKGSAPVFANISPQVESLTDRRFTYNHLAQLKFIMPEEIMVEKVMRHDERTSCMRPDLRVTLNEAVKSKSNSQSLGGNLRLRKVFRDRLLKFFKSHPEAEEVPEEPLPEPFSRLKKNASANSVQSSTSNSITETPLFGRQSFPSSHLSPSFKPRFAQKASSHSIEYPKRDQPVVSEEKTPTRPSEKQSIPNYSNSPSKLPHNLTHTQTPVKCVNSVDNYGQSSILNTPAGIKSTPAELMSATPALRPPKRSHMSPDDNSSYRSPSKLVKRPPPNRPLKFDTPVKNSKLDFELDISESRSTGGADDVLDILPDALIQSIREKERLAAIERDPAISRAKLRQKMIAGLPKRFDTIYYLFQSMGRSVVTKEELIQKIITGDLNVTDRNEVEEQLTLLKELVPEWIYEKSIMSGDLLICVNKSSSPEVIRTRLSEAK